MPLIQAPGDQTDPAVSPDGQWIAYESDESGRAEIYVDRFPELGARRILSVAGGFEPLWNPMGGEVFYRNGDAVMVVPINQAGSELGQGVPRELFSGSARRWRHG